MLKVDLAKAKEEKRKAVEKASIILENIYIINNRKLVNMNVKDFSKISK